MKWASGARRAHVEYEAQPYPAWTHRYTVACLWFLEEIFQFQQFLTRAQPAGAPQRERNVQSLPGAALQPSEEKRLSFCRFVVVMLYRCFFLKRLQEIRGCTGVILLFVMLHFEFFRKLALKNTHACGIMVAAIHKKFIP